MMELLHEIGVQAGTLIGSTLRGATPLILCALAGCLAERSGVVDLGLEGKMLLSAFAAASVGAATGSWVPALAVALALGVSMSLVQGWGCVTHQGDQVVMGMALTMTAAGLTVVLGGAWFGLGGQTPQVGDGARLTGWFTDAAQSVQALPVLGPMLGLGLMGHNGLVYWTLLCVLLVWVLLFHTRFGLRLRAVGENPLMVDAAGVSVRGLRHQALALNGMLAGLAGTYLVLALNANFIPHMTAGRGYMALAALIFGKWNPLGALAACLLFGFLDALAIRLQGAPWPEMLGGGTVPVQAIQALPYLLTVVLLAGFIGRARAPAALGVPYLKER
ncbi:MAG: ABC transporter permease [Burkholderiaceae bacterium]|jgi:simple sugar transport system permease protein